MGYLERASVTGCKVDRLIDRINVFHQTSQHFAGMHAKRVLRRFDIFVAKRYI